MAVLPDAADPARYHDASAIRTFLLTAPALLQAAVHERWAVKTAADPDAQPLTQQVPSATTIEALTALPVPALLPPNGRADGAEKTVFEVQATLTAYRAPEGDGDIHMVLGDAQGRTMIAEIPKPGDMTAPSHFAAQISDARKAFDARFNVAEVLNDPTPSGNPTPQIQHVSVPVTVTGLGFFDFAHGQLGVAPNAIELHPVVAVAFHG
jgi:hypothetical protein